MARRASRSALRADDGRIVALHRPGGLMFYDAPRFEFTSDLTAEEFLGQMCAHGKVADHSVELQFGIAQGCHGGGAGRVRVPRRPALSARRLGGSGVMPFGGGGLDGVDDSEPAGAGAAGMAGAGIGATPRAATIPVPRRSKGDGVIPRRGVARSAELSAISSRRFPWRGEPWRSQASSGLSQLRRGPVRWGQWPLPFGDGLFPVRRPHP